MDYNDHETEQYFKQKTRTLLTAPNLEQGRETLRRIAQASQLEEVIRQHQDNDSVEYNLRTTHTGFHLNSGLVVSEGTHPRSVLFAYEESKSFFENLGNTRNLIFSYKEAHAEPFTGISKHHLLKIHRSVNWSELIENLKNAYGAIPEHLWNMLHDRITDHFNEILIVNWRIKWRCDSVMEDYNDIIRLVRGDQPPEVGNAVENSCRYVLDMLHLIPENKDCDGSEDDCGLLMGRSQTVAFLPIHSQDVEFGLQDDIGIIRESGNPAMFSACKRIFELISKNTRYVRIQTSDGRDLFLYRAFFAPDVYLAGKAPYYST